MQTHGRAQISCHPSSWHPVCLEDCLSLGRRSLDWQDCTLYAWVCANSSISSELYTDSLLPTIVTFKHLAVLHCMFWWRLTILQTPNPAWSNATTLTIKRILSKHTSPPKQGWYEWISGQLLLCQTSVRFHKRRGWWQDTNTNNECCYWGDDWGILINGSRAAGQRCSLKTIQLSPEGQNGASINWQADVLEFLSWALMGWWDAGLQCFENQCGFPIKRVL